MQLLPPDDDIDADRTGGVMPFSTAIVTRTTDSARPQCPILTLCDLPRVVCVPYFAVSVGPS